MKNQKVQRRDIKNKWKVGILLGCVVIGIVAICVWKQNTVSVHHNEIENINISSTPIGDKTIEAVLSGQEIAMESEWGQILAKNAAEITDEEYIQLAAVLICENDEETFEQMVEQCFDVTEHNYLIFKKQEYNPTEKFYKLVKAEELITQRMLDYYITEEDFEGIVYDRFAIALQYQPLLQKLAEEPQIVTSTFFFDDDNKKMVDLVYQDDGSKKIIYRENVLGTAENVTVTKIRRGQFVGNSVLNESEYYRDMLWAPKIDWIEKDKKSLIDDIGSTWRVAEYFDLLYVGVDVNEDVTLHESHLYETSGTAKMVEAFNIYMDSEDGHELSRLIDYTHYVPSGELTCEYILENTTDVIHMLNAVHKHESMEGVDYLNRIMKVYEEMQ